MPAPRRSEVKKRPREPAVDELRTTPALPAYTDKRVKVTPRESSLSDLPRILSSYDPGKKSALRTRLKDTMGRLFSARGS